MRASHFSMPRISLRFGSNIITISSMSLQDIIKADQNLRCTGRKARVDMQISFSLPDNQFLAESPEEATQKIRMYAALGLYQAGELSIGAASEVAGIDRYAFLDFCKREGIILHTQTIEELEADLNKFKSGK